MRCTSQAQNLKVRAQNFDLHRSDPQRSENPNLNGPALGSAPPGTGSPGPFGPGTPEESEKSPERVPRGRTPKVPKECTLKSQNSPKRVQNLTFGSFRTLLRLWSALFRGSGDSFGLFSDYSGVPGPKGPGDPVPGGADPNHK